MIFTCLGHSKFLIELMSGMRICTDPFDASTGYPVGDTEADVVLVSHHHHDHDAVETLRGVEKVIDTEGTHTLAFGTQVHMLASYHDDKQGSLRGSNLIAVLETEGLRVAHLGDLGHLPDEDLYAKIGHVDVLLIPVGGYFTIDAQQALEICKHLKPQIILPMHYKTAFNDDWPIAKVDAFLDACKRELGKETETLDLLRVTADDLSCQPSVCVLRAQV
ncbi:MAG: MBL fold metallo-hydrolase [Clostridia bacterium]|nr:MBL fold metallo-hydrolase [Clostridia bacterium]MBR1685342.1 MBL fold metallo-hydrolase [Clostridia bacterium]